MQKLSKYIKPVLAGIAVAVILLSILQMTGFFNRPGMKDSQNPYEYNLDKLKKVDSDLLLWKELEPIDVPLVKLSGITIDNNDNLFVTGDWSVIKYNSSGYYISKFDLGDKAGCITTGPNNKLYLGMGDHIEVYFSSGKKIEQWAQIDSNSVITSIAVSKDYIFVADAGNRIVRKLNQSGEMLGIIGEQNREKGIPGFIIPSPYFDLGFGHDGELWVVNPGRHLFHNFSPKGELISSWGKASQLIDGFCGCCNPSHFTIMPNGSFITSEKGLPRVKEYNPAGELISVVAGANNFNEGTTNLDVVTDSKGRVIVLDPARKQIRIFERK